MTNPRHIFRASGMHAAASFRMSFLRDKRALVAAGLVVVLCASVALFLVDGADRRRRVLFFPSVTSGKLIGEQRYLPAQRSAEREVELVVRELLLGPSTLAATRIVPRGTRATSVLVRDRTAYVNFSDEMLFPDASVKTSLGQMLQGVANTLYFNFPWLRDVKLFIRGQIPEIWGMDTDHLRWSKKLLE